MVRSGLSRKFFCFLSASCLFFASCTMDGEDVKEERPDLPSEYVDLAELIVMRPGTANLITFRPDITNYTVSVVKDVNYFYVRPYIRYEGDRVYVAIKRGSRVDQITHDGTGTYSIPVPSNKELETSVEVEVFRIRYNAEGEVSRTLVCVYILSIFNPFAEDYVLGTASQAIDRAMSGVIPVIGNPAKNPPEARAVTDIIEKLNELLKGSDAQRSYNEIDINGHTSNKLENYTDYDIRAISRKTEELEEAVERVRSSLTQYIRIPSMFVQFTGEDVRIRLEPFSAAVYKLEAVGASGGHITNTSTLSSNFGGRGGFVSAKFELPADTRLAARVGGRGEGTATYDVVNQNYTLITKNYTNVKAGGWPNGGKGGAGSGGSGRPAGNADFVSSNEGYPTWAPGSGGGGSTDWIILGVGSSAKTDSSGVVFTYVPESDPRILVAGGGGGAAQRANVPWPVAPGGTAYTGSNFSEAVGTGWKNLLPNDVNNFPVSKPGEKIDFSAAICTPANPAHVANNSDFGRKGNDGYYNITGPTETGEGSGGGGGGFRGGGANEDDDRSGLIDADNFAYVFMSGAGGTNHIHPGTTYPVSEEVNETAAVYGNGWAKITWIVDK